MKKTCFSLVFLLASFSVFSEELPVERVNELLATYVSTHGCLLKLPKNNVIPIKDPYEKGQTTYIAYYFIDHHCSGGSGSYELGFAAFRYYWIARKMQLQLLPERSFPSAKIEGFPRSVNKIFKKTEKKGNETFWYTAKEYATDDANCCPSIVVEKEFIITDEGRGYLSK